jgi:predicted DNA-binding mobile mystery protein A
MVKLRESKRGRAALDSRLSSLGPTDKYAPPRSGWVRAVRDALGMSAAELGRRMGVSHSAVFELEGSERSGTTRLDTLRRAAEALDCTLVYAFIPRDGLEATVRARAEELADEDLRHVKQTMALEDQAEQVGPEAREEIIQQLIDSRGLWSRR